MKNSPRIGISDNPKSAFEAAVEAFVSSRRLLRKGPGAAPVVVGVSGGADSVALLFSLHALGYDVRAAHCNFHLRGAESARDMRHVQDLCRALGVDLYVKDFDVPARQRATGESTEMACRSLRYEWFASLLDREYAQALAVGHHREDQVETVLLNLLRGTGPAGLAGMKPRNSAAIGGLTVVRPLLERSRAEIEEYLRACGVAWVTDSSNLADDFLRNRIRHSLLPLLEEIRPGALDGIVRTAAQTAEAMELYQNRLRALAADCMEASRLDLAALSAAAGSSAHMALFELLRPMGFGMTHARNILDAFRAGASGLVFQAPAWRAELSRGVLELIPEGAQDRRAAAEEPVSVDLRRDVAAPLRIAVTYRPVSDFAAELAAGPLSPKVAFVDADAAGSGRWELRHWRNGDRMRPYGLAGSKLVSDIFAAARLDARRKREAWLLTRDGEIVWIPGIRCSAIHTVGPGTRRYLRLEID